jgi:hypothetical protein
MGGRTPLGRRRSTFRGHILMPHPCLHRRHQWRRDMDVMQAFNKRLIRRKAVREKKKDGSEGGRPIEGKKMMKED